MIPRTLEVEAMDTPEEAAEYDKMDHSAVNAKFVADFLAAHGACRGGWIVDVGTGTARIPIELARADANARVVGADLSEPMLAVGRKNIQEAGLTARVMVKKVDAKGFDDPSGFYEAVISNSIVHHIPDPSKALAEMARLVAPGGTLFCRDLARPESAERVDELVERYASGETEVARALFSASLHAALTLEEIQAIVEALGMPKEGVAMTSDRHWTWTWKA